MKKRGTIIPNGVNLENHEYKTVLFFTNLGFDIELIPQERIKNKHTPDIKMNGFEWEMKSPKNNGSRTIEHAIRSAAKQSENIIIDLRRSKIPDKRAIFQIKYHSEKRPTVKRLKVVSKSGKLLDIK